MTDLKNLNLTILKKKDTNSILDLINLIQPNIPWSKEYFNWQFFENPLGSAKIYGVKNLEKKVVAIYAAIPKNIKLENYNLKGRMIQDVMTHPDYRGQGFLHKLSAICLDDIKKNGEFGYTFPNEKSERSFRRNNWHELCSIPFRTKFISKNLDSKINLDLTKIEGNFDQSISSIWDFSGIKIGINRNAEYLNWRYRKPGIKYFKFILNSNEGILILKIFKEKRISFLHICDLIVKENKKELILSALKFSEQFAKKNNCKVLTSWCNKNHFYSKYYDEFKMNLSSISRYCLIFFNNKKFQDLKISGKWYLSQGDSDVY